VVVVLLGGLIGYGAAHEVSTGGADAHAASAERTGCAAAAAVSPTPSLEDSIMADAFDRAGSGLDQQLAGDVANFRRALDPASRRLALDAIRGRRRALHEG